MNSIVPEQLELFNPSRWPRKPYCSDDLESGLVIRSLASALKKPYIQANPPHLRIWSIFDVDRAGAAVAWEDAGLPPPSWSSMNRANGHAHLVYGISAPVLLEAEDARRAPMRYLCAVEAAFRNGLRADQGYAGLITKNPSHPLWRTLRGPRLSYDLGELADYIDLPKHLPKRKPEEVGLGRNVTLFDWLRHYAYRNLRRYKTTGEGITSWRVDLNLKAMERNGEFLTPLDPSEVTHIVKSVAKWTWSHFDIDESDRKFAALQSERGRRSGLARLSASEDKRASARLMASQGMSQRAIGATLGVSQAAVLKWLKVNTEP